MKLQEAGLCLVGFFMGLFLWGNGEVNAQYVVSGEVLDVGMEYADVRIQLGDNGAFKPVPVSNHGHFFTTLNWDKTYHFVFKKPGYVSKIIEFSTKVPDNYPKKKIEPYKMQVHLFEVFKGVDTVFFKNPIAKIRFDASTRYFADDRDYSLNVKYKIEQMRKKAHESEEVNRKKEKRRVKKKTQNTSTNKRTKTDATHPLTKIEEDDDMAVPPLKAHYKDGRTEEVFELQGRTIIRTVYCNNSVRKVFLCVKHHWGANFYFLHQESLGYRCISREVYHQMLKQLK